MAPPRERVAFGQWVKQERQRHGLRQQTLAQRAGLSQSRLSRIETGRSKKDRDGYWRVEVLLLQLTQATPVDLPAVRQRARQMREQSAAMRQRVGQLRVQTQVVYEESVRLLARLQGAAD